MNMKEAGHRRFSLENLIGDPFALVTVSVASLAWFIAFVASAVSNAKAAFPHYAWWTVVYMLFAVIGVTIVFLSNSGPTYHVAIVGFLSAGLVFTTSAVNTLVYDTAPYKEAAGAGHILLSMVSIVWIFYFGSQPQAASRNFVDSFALNKGSTIRGSAMPAAYGQSMRRDTQMQTPQMYSSSHLNGLETTSPVATGFGGAAAPSHSGLTQGRLSVNNAGQQTYQQAASTVAPSQAGETAPSTVGGELALPTEYPYKAKAVYSYEANPEDANEISFTKHEILEVSDVSGRWWQARKENGETGIAPSNYLMLL